MNRTVKHLGPYAKIKFDRKLSQSIPGQFVYIDGKPFAIYESDESSFSILVKGDSFLVENIPQEISEPKGGGFPNLLSRHAIAIAGGTGVGAVMPVIHARNKQGLTTSVIIYARGDITTIRDDQPCLSLCGDVILWDTASRGRPRDPLAPISNIHPGSAIFMVGPKSLTAAIKEAADRYNLSCNTNY